MGASTTGGQTEICPILTGANSPGSASSTSRLTALRYTGFIKIYGIAIAAEPEKRCTQMARLYIGNLPHVTAEPELQTWVEQNGFKVESVQVIRDLDTGASRGFAFIELPEVRNAQEAVDALNGQK